MSARTVRAPAHRPAPNAARLAVALVLAVAGPAAGAQPVAVASGAGPAARDVAPAGRSARDSAMTTARTFARAGAIDAAIRAYEAWLAAEPDDAAAWRDLAVQRRRAGRMREGIAALERAQALDPDDGTGRRIRQWRAAAAASVEPEVVGTRDSDGNVTRRAGLAVGLADRARTRVTASAARRRADDGLTGAAIDEGRLTAVWRPRAALRVELAGGVARTGYRVTDTTPAAESGGRGRGRGQVTRTASGAVVSTARAGSTVPLARARVRWAAPNGANVDVRAGRTMLDLTPLLVRNRVARDEVAAQADLPTPVGVRVRALGRLGTIASALDRNTRTNVGGGLVLPIRGVGELSATGQQFAYAHRSRSGYFSPRLARQAELGAYVDRETAGGIAVTLDAGAGYQRITEHGGVPGPWQPTLRGTLGLLAPVGPGRSVRVELDGFDGRTGDVETFGRWRYGSASIGMRWVR